MATPTTEEILTLRRMVAEPIASDTYSNADLSAAIARYPLPDADGLDPDATLWAGSWDLNRAAADIWYEKAAAVAANFDFAADGGSYSRSQVYAQCIAMAKSFAAKRQAGSVTLIATPKPLGAKRAESWIGNLSESAMENNFD